MLAEEVDKKKIEKKGQEEQQWRKEDP